MVPVAGSAYTYTYATLGELVAFIIGWDLVLEFTVAPRRSRSAGRGYLNAHARPDLRRHAAGLDHRPARRRGRRRQPARRSPSSALIAFLLVRGIRITAKANIVIAAITVAVLLLVIVVGGTEVDSGNWTPFMPFGWDGIVGGAAVVFFAYIGFDIVATTAEETPQPAARHADRHPRLARDRHRPVLRRRRRGDRACCRTTELGGAAPLADAFEAVDRPWTASFVYAGALVALTNTVLILMLGQTRVGFAMARDRLFPPGLAKTHPRYGTPARLTIIIAVGVSVLAGFTGIDTLADLVNIGTLFAFMLVAIGVILLRRADPERPRPFRTPLVPVAADRRRSCCRSG